MDRKMILNIPLITREQDFWTWHYEKSGIFFFRSVSIPDACPCPQSGIGEGCRKEYGWEVGLSIRGGTEKSLENPGKFSFGGWHDSQSLHEMSSITETWRLEVYVCCAVLLTPDHLSQIPMSMR